MEYLKELSIKDIKELVELNIKTWKESYKEILPTSFLKSLEKNKDLLIKEEEDRFIDDKLDGTRKYLFKIDDISVGYLVIGRCGIEEYNGLGEINALYLVNEAKHKGYGKFLFNRALKELKDMGFTETIIGVLKDSFSNKFFLDRGAMFLKENKRYIMDIEIEENLYLYSLLGDKMDGIILVDKEEGVTSRDVVNSLIHLFNTKKIGHTGTLDPIATGVLVVCIGNSTKLVEMLSSEDKEYIATIKLGIKTDTLDITGNIIEERGYNFTIEKLKEVLNSFVGENMETVPLYSAVKVKGKKLYEYARNNIEVELPKRKVNIKEIELISYENDEIVFRTTVSKGTYIRSLIDDICTKLGTVGTMKSLRRTRQGEYKIDECNTLEEIKNNNYQIITKEEFLKGYETKSLTKEEFEKVKNGSIVSKHFNDKYCVFKYDGKVVAIYQTYHKDDTLAKPFKMFV